MEYQMDDFTCYYAWCKFPGCGFATEDTSSKTVAVADMREHWADDHDAEDSEEVKG